MIIYEVNLKPAPEIREEFISWLYEHVAQMNALDGFCGYQVYFDEDNEIICHYQLQDRDALDRYFEKDASRMRQDGKNRFGDLFTASRRILTPQ